MVGKTNEEAILIRLGDLEARAFDMQKRLEALEQEAHMAIDRHMARNWQDAAARLRQAAKQSTDHTKEIDHENIDDAASEGCSRGGREHFTRSGFQTGLPGGCLATGQGWAQAALEDRDMADPQNQVWPITAADLERGEPG